MATDETSSSESKPDQGRRTGSRLGLAAAFAFVGAKLGTLGVIKDANKLYEGESLTLGQKIWGAMNGTLWKKLQDKINAGNPANTLEKAEAYIKASKHMAIWTGVTAGAGAMLGLWRGGRIEHPKDIIIHPIQSLKIALGPEPKEPEKAPAPLVASNTTEPPDDSGRWQEAAGRSKTEIAPGR